MKRTNLKKRGVGIIVICGLLASSYAGQFKDSSDIIFNDSIVHRYNLSFYIQNWEDTLKYNKEVADEAYMPCRFTYYLPNGDSVVLDSVGVRYKGNSSYEVAKDSPKKSFKFCFNEYKEQLFFGVERLNLNNGVADPSYIREKLSYDLARKYMPAPRACFATLSINGEMIGVYTQVEQIDEYFLKRNFEKSSGNLYKAGDDGAYLQYKGPNQSSYEKSYELKTNRSKNDWSNFINMIYKLNNTPKEEFVPIVSLCLNLDNCIRHLAWTIILSHFDSYTGSGRNYYMYDDPKSGKFFIIPWDLNMSFGQYPIGWDVIKNSCINIKNLDDRPLNKRILENDSLKRVYLNYLREMINGPFSAENIAKEADRIVSVIDSVVKIEPEENKFYSYEEFRKNVDSNLVIGGTLDRKIIYGIKTFSTLRNAELLKQLESGVLEPQSMKAPNGNSLSYLWKDRKGILIVNYRLKEKGINDEIKITNCRGKVLYKSRVNPTKDFIEINIKGMPAGIYTIVFYNSDIIASEKFVIAK